MSFSKLLDKLFKNGGSGPTVNDGIVAKDISIQPWDSTYDYAGGEIVRGGGSYPSNLTLYQAKQASGPNTSAGSKNPANSQNIEYWQVFSTTGSIPVGTIIWYSSSTAPVGYLICNGQAVSRTTYPDLFTAIGTTYGAGDGSTTFNLPNLLNKFIEGANSNVGDSVAAGLPNIEGSVGWNGNSLFSRATGSFSGVEATGNQYVQIGSTDYNTSFKHATFNASQSNSIYGNSNTVQPPAVKLLPCIKAYSDVDNLGSLDVAQLENYVQNNVVHKTGIEVVEGEKTFLNAHHVTSTVINDGLMSNIAIQHPTVDRYGEHDPLYENWSSIVFLDKNKSIDRDYSSRLAMIQYTNYNAGSEFYRSAFLFRLYSEDPSKTSDIHARIGLYQDLDYNIIAIAPSTMEGRTNGTDIVTRDWIPKDTRIVHTTTAETIAGVKTFTSEPVVHLSGESMLDLNSDGAGYVLGVGIGSSKAAGFYNRTNSKWLYQWVPSTGTFNIHAVTTGTAKSLVGDTGGTLKWNGQTVQTSSDERLKTPITNVNPDILDAWSDVQWGEFKFLDAVEEKGENARYHLGLIAQSVDRVFKNRGRDILKYGILCHDEREATEDEEAVDLWMVRYTEALCMEAAYNRREVKRLKEEINLLKQRLDSLENS